MQFYCPNCQTTIEAEPTATVTTKFNQMIYKAPCPVCQQDTATYGPPSAPDTTEPNQISA